MHPQHHHASDPPRRFGLDGPAVRWLALPALLALHFGIQLATRELIVFRHLTDDPLLLRHGSWLHYLNHHLGQMAIALLLIALMTRGRLAAAGLNLGNARQSLRLLTRGFFPVLLLCLLAGHTLTPLLQGTPPARFAGGIRALDLAGMLLFSWVIVGLSEEIVFRGLFQTVFARFWRGSVSMFGV
jgi:membrane protease YdiL (CAAX protease family)